MRILVSACLLGLKCRYDAQAKPLEQVLRLADEHCLVPFCPEAMGGLPTPRPCAERRGDLVVTREGADVTEAYQRGAEETMRIARKLGLTIAILKENSPSCGSSHIYDGSFTGALVPGMGVTSALLRQNGVEVVSEKEVTLRFT